MARHLAGAPPPPAQDALSDATNIERSERESNGITFYQYDIDSPVSNAPGLATFASCEPRRPPQDHPASGL
jgi:hypothetical protein